jgi:hypothetical protein
MDTPPKSRTDSGGIPRSPASLRDPLPRGREPLRIGDMSERQLVNRRTRPGFGPNSRWSRGKSACNRGAHRHGRIGFFQSLPPALRAAWGHDADRIAERIALWRSSARRSYRSRYGEFSKPALISPRQKSKSRQTVPGGGQKPHRFRAAYGTTKAAPFQNQTFTTGCHGAVGQMGQVRPP